MTDKRQPEIQAEDLQVGRGVLGVFKGRTRACYIVDRGDALALVNARVDGHKVPIAVLGVTHLPRNALKSFRDQFEAACDLVLERHQ